MNFPPIKSAVAIIVVAIACISGCAPKSADGKPLRHVKAGDFSHSFEEVAAVMEQMMPRLKASEEKLLQLDHNAGGMLMIEFIIQADGFVREPKILKSDFGQHPEFEQDVVNLMRTVRFEPVDRGELKVAVPLFFKAVTGPGKPHWSVRQPSPF